jgi:YD repeat-containing protein
VDAEGYVRHNEYDGRGRLVTVTRYANPVAAGTASDMASLAAAVQPNPSVDQVTRYQYDADGNLTSVVDPLGHAQTYTYDALGHQLSCTDKKGATWQYEYDAAGRMIRTIAPEVSVTAVSLDANGNLAIDPNGSGKVRLQTTITYDAFGHVQSRTEAANTPQARTTTYEYDAQGRQTKVIYPPVAIYDAAADNLAVNGANGLRCIRRRRRIP